MAVLYAVALAVLVYREMSLAALVGCLARAATTMGVFLLTAFCLVLLPAAIRATRDVHAQLGAAIEVPLSLVFASLPLALVLMAWWSLLLALQALRVRAPK